MEWNGDILQAMDEDDDIGYVVPKEGGLLWEDALCIPKGGQNIENAHALINYILDGQVGADIADYVYYATPNKAAKNLMSGVHRKPCDIPTRLNHCHQRSFHLSWPGSYTKD